MRIFNLLICLICTSYLLCNESDQIMSEKELQGLLETMTIHQLQEINTMIDNYLEQEQSTTVPHTQDEDAEREKYINQILIKVKQHPELYEVETFGFILEGISNVFEDNDEESINHNY
jgi:hypothetical protein